MTFSKLFVNLADVHPSSGSFGNQKTKMAAENKLFFYSFFENEKNTVTPLCYPTGYDAERQTPQK